VTSPITEKIDRVTAYDGFEVVAVPLDEWRARWLPGLAEDGMHVGLNWSGPRASGYDISPGNVERNLSARQLM
jgi:Protein of unknown function (DUF2750)